MELAVPPVEVPVVVLSEDVDPVHLGIGRVGITGGVTPIDSTVMAATTGQTLSSSFQRLAVLKFNH